MAIDIFSTRYMMKALKQLKPARSFLRDTFFPNTVKFDAETVDIDIYKGKRRVAAYVHPKLQGKLIERQGFTTQSYKPAYIKMKTVTTAQDQFKREIDTTIYDAESADVRATKVLTKDLATLDEMITRAEEIQAMQALTTGTVTISGDGVNDTIDFSMSASHKPTLTSTAKWDAPTTAKPIDDLRTWRRLIAQDCGIVPTHAIMSSDAMEKFMACQQTKDTYNMLKVNNGQINPQALPNGVTYHGFVAELGLDLYTYDEWYIDEITDPGNITEKSLIPAKTVILASDRGTMNSKLYGAIQDLDAGLVPTNRFAKSWKEEDPSARILLVQSAPLISLLQPDSVVTATVF